MTNPIMTSMGHYVPKTEISNEFLDSLDIGSDSQWILDRVGIRSRRSVLELDDIRALRNKEASLESLRRDKRILPMSEMFYGAAEIAQKRNPSLDLASLELLICGTSTPDYKVPANACVIADRLGASRAAAFDVNSACSSFVVAMSTATGMMKMGMARKAMTTIADRYTNYVDYSERKNCILFGDSAALATIEVPAPGVKGLEVVDIALVTNTTKWNAVAMAEGEAFNQDGAAVQKFAISKTIEVTDTILRRNDLSSEDISYFVGHQANYRMLTYIGKHYNFQDGQHLHNIQEMGNQGASGAPTVLSQNWEKYRDGDLIVLTVVGAGLTWGSMLLKYVSL